VMDSEEIEELFFFSSRRRHTRLQGDWSSDVCSSDLLDAARLYRLALEKQEAGARYHAVAEEGVRFRDIADAIGRGLKVPVVSKSAEEAAAHFGFLGMFVTRDLIGSSVQTRRRMGWHPSGPGLIADLDEANYFQQIAQAARQSP